MIKRELTKDLKRLATQYPVVTITGPRQAGKTRLCQSCFPQYDYVNLESPDKRRRAIDDPKGFLSHFSQGVILDEIQRAPELPSYIQEIVDKQQRPGMFILTGSQQFEVTHSISQSLAGRTAVLKLLPCTINEVNRFEQPPQNLNQRLYYGSYPRIFDKKLDPTEAYSFYLETYIERDLRSLINIKNLNSFERFLKLCAAHIGNLINYSSLGNACDIDQKTIKSWLSTLEASYIIFTLSPHYNNFKKRLTKSDKLYFYDVGLAAYLLDITEPQQVENHPLRGHLFENFVVSEILKQRFNHLRGNNLYFFRDHVGNEVDLLLDYTITVTPIEIKVTQTVSASHFKGLQYYKKLNNQLKGNAKLIYGGEESYVHQDVDVLSYTQIGNLEV